MVTGFIVSPAYLSLFFVMIYSTNSCFITTSRDMTARLFTLNPVEGFRPKTFAGHRDAVLGAYFSADGNTVRFLDSHLALRY